MGVVGYGTKFERSGDGGVNWSQIAGLIDIEDGEVSRGSTDQTTIDGTSGYKEFLPSALRDAGSVTITLIWDEADQGQIDLAADLDSDANVDYRAVYPGGEIVTFVGHITSWGKAVPIEDRITRKVAFKISGKPVVT